MIIGIHGKKQHGKDTACKMMQFLFLKRNLAARGQKLWDQGPQSSTDPLFNYRIWDRWTDRQRADNSGWHRKFFAEKLKQMVCLLIGCTMEQLEDDDFKNKELGEEWRVYWVRAFNFENKVETYLFSSEAELKSKHKVETTPNRWGTYLLTPRLILQLLGTEGGRNIIHPKIWINALMVDYKAPHKVGERVKIVRDAERSKTDPSKWVIPNDPDVPESRGKIIINTSQYMFYKTIEEEVYPNWIITDVRFPDEYQAIKDRGGLLLKVVNPRVVSTDTHASETSLDHYEDEMWDGLVINDAGFDKLLFEVEYFLDSHQTKLGL